MVIEHEVGDVPPREHKKPVAKYRSKQEAPKQKLPPASVQVIPQPLDVHAAAVWAYAQQKVHHINQEQDQSSNSNY